MSGSYDKTGELRVPYTEDEANGYVIDKELVTVDGVVKHRQKIAVSSSALPAGAATSANQTNGAQKMQIMDLQLGKSAEVNSLGRLITTEPTRLVGSLFETTTKDTQQWQEAFVGTGSATQQNGEILLKTGVTANSAATYCTVEHARFVAGSVNVFQFVGFFATTATANNERRVGLGEFTDHTPTGAVTPNNGFGFYLNGTEFGIWYRSLSLNAAGIVRVPSGSFSTGLTYTLTNSAIVEFEVEYSHGRVDFFIDDVLYHTQRPSTDILTDTMNLHAFAQNINSGGATDDVSFMLHVLTISRYGQPDTTPVTRRVAGVATTILKSGPGSIHTVINSVRSVASTITVWDGLTGAAPSRQILTIDAANFQGGLDFHSTFRDGLTVVTDKATSDITFIFE